MRRMWSGNLRLEKSHFGVPFRQNLQMRRVWKNLQQSLFIERAYQQCKFNERSDESIFFGIIKNKEIIFPLSFFCRFRFKIFCQIVFKKSNSPLCNFIPKVVDFWDKKWRFGIVCDFLNTFEVKKLEKNWNIYRKKFRI